MSSEAEDQLTILVGINVCKPSTQILVYMNILLLGEYSGLHYTLAKALKKLGHNVTLASDGDGFKNYTRDIDLKRKSSGLKDTFINYMSVTKEIKKIRNFDVVQIINPNFTNLNSHINLQLYKYLKQHNKKIFLGAFGNDYFWLKACLEQKYRYSEFYINNKENKLEENEQIKKTWLYSYAKTANEEIAQSCDGIIACLYEYYIAYKNTYNHKLAYIPLPIDISQNQLTTFPPLDKLQYFIGVNAKRDSFKGTDILYKALIRLKNNYPDEIDLMKIESLSYNEYILFMQKAHIVLDQLYSYSPAMNALLAMSLGKIVVGGGEPEMYALIDEFKNRPIANVYPNLEDAYMTLENLLFNKQKLYDRSIASRKFVEEHHDYMQVAKQYITFWEQTKK